MPSKSTPKKPLDLKKIQAVLPALHSLAARLVETQAALQRAAPLPVLDEWYKDGHITADEYRELCWAQGMPSDAAHEALVNAHIGYGLPGFPAGTNEGRMDVQAVYPPSSAKRGRRVTATPKLEKHPSEQE